MSFNNVSYGGTPVASMGASTRGRFLVKTYLHLLGAMALFVAIEAAIINSQAGLNLIKQVSGRGLLLIGAFILISWVGSHVAHTAKSKGMQYLALVGFVGMYAVFFSPLIYMAQLKTGDNSLLMSAAVMTMLAFSSLSAIVFFTGKDFSFMGSFLKFFFLVAIFTILAGFIFKFNLGLGFSALMVLLAGGAILYDTSNVLHHYNEDRYVGAALELFSSVAMMFYYILRIFMSRD